MNGMNEKCNPQCSCCFKCEKCFWHGASYRQICPVCGSQNIVEACVAGKGEVVDFVPVSFPPESLKDIGPYVTVLVNLDEQCMIFGIFSGNPQNLRIGSRVFIRDFHPESRRLYFETS